MSHGMFAVNEIKDYHQRTNFGRALVNLVGALVTVRFA